MKAVAENYMIQTVSRALDLLEQFQECNSELGITDLSNRLNLQKNNVFRLVATLTAKQYIEMNNLTGKYRLGIKSRALAQAATHQIDFVNHAHPYLNELKRVCHEACYFSVVKDGYTFYLDGVESDLPVRVAQRVGSSRPLYCTAAGKVQLAFMEQQKRADALGVTDLKRHTSRTITDPALLLGELENVLRKGYAVDDQEHDAGVMEIAAPVFDSQGIVIGALSILGPEMRLAGIRLESEFLPLLCQSALRLSISLGYQRPETSGSERSCSIPGQGEKKRPLKAKPFGMGGLKTCC